MRGFFCREGVIENLRHIPHAPGVQMQPMGDDAYASKLLNAEDIARDNANPDVRLHRKLTSKEMIKFANSTIVSYNR